ncbi:polysaccharide deacetylase family protein [bacterium]|nr:polysaccharide deacetylase family protein [bacterium]
MRFYHSNFLFKAIFPSCLWNGPQTDRYYLTFDDGPTPEVTPWVLDFLKEHGIKATFFCVGANVEKYPDLYKRIIAEGHRVGNHTYSHLSAWEHSTKNWLADFDKAAALIDSNLVRPPYGKMTPMLVKKLSRRGYRIVMWTFITYDFDIKADMHISLNYLKSVKPGSIIVMHDQPKAAQHIKMLLPALVALYQNAPYDTL